MPPLHIIDGKTFDPHKRTRVASAGIFFAAPFTLAWHHRDLIVTILRRELHERFKGSIAGWVWAVVAPLLSLAIYTIAFSGMVKLPGDFPSNARGDYALFIFGGLVAFNFFSEMAYRAPSLLHEYSHFVKQTMFPVQLLPIISTLRATVYAGIALAIMLAAQLISTGSLPWTALLLLVWFVVFVMFLIGLTWLLSAMGAFTRDASYLMVAISPLLMFLTPVFYSQDTLAPRARMLIYANPLTGFIDIIRDLVVFGVLPGLAICAWTVFCSLAFFWFGFWFFEKQRDGIADVI